MWWEIWCLDIYSSAKQNFTNKETNKHNKKKCHIMFVFIGISRQQTRFNKFRHEEGLKNKTCQLPVLVYKSLAVFQ